MGNSKSSSVAPGKKSNQGYYFYYLNRRDECVYFICDEKIEKKKFEKPIGILADSGIGFINQMSIMSVGGTGHFSRLKKTGFIIDMDQMFVRNIAKFPFHCKEGTLIPYKGCIYYAGGFCIRPSNENHQQLTPTPLFRYRVLENKWEVLTNNGFSKENFDDGFNTHFIISKLSSPGIFLFKSILYFFCGLINSNPNHAVFTFDIETLKLQTIKFRFKVPLLSPMCSSNSNFVFITGGSTLENLNKTCYVFKPKKGFKEIKSKNLETSENYPSFSTDDFIVQSAFPKFAVKGKNKEDWKIYNLSGDTCLVASTKLPQVSKNHYISKSPVTLTARRGFAAQSTVPHSSRDDLLSHSILHISYSTVRTHNSKKTNSPEFSAYGYDTVNSKTVEQQVQDIVTRENDEVTKVSKKALLKMIQTIQRDLEFITPNALRLHQLSYTLGKKPEIPMNEVFDFIQNNLTKTNYPYKIIKFTISNIYKSCRETKANSKKLNEILEFMQIPEMVSNVSRETTVLILTRVIKAMIGFT